MLYFINAILMPSQGVLNCYIYIRISGDEKSVKIRNTDPQGRDVIVSAIDEVNSSVGDNSNNNDERSSSSILLGRNSDSDDSSCFSVSMNFFEFLGS